MSADTGMVKKLQEFRKELDSDKIVKIDDLEEKLRLTDEVCRSEHINNLTSNFKLGMSIFSAVLTNAYRSVINENRRNALKVIRREGVKKRVANPNKVLRENVIPEEYMKCRSPTAMAALALFCLYAERSQIRKAAFLTALSGEYKNASSVMKMTKDPKVLLAEDASTHDEPKVDVLGRIIQALMESAELARDKTLSKLAMEMDESLYSKAVEHYVDRQTFNSMYPFEPLRVKYLKNCVGQMFVRMENVKLSNQYKIDPQRTIRFLLDNVHIASRSVANSQTAAQSRKTRSASIKFDEGRMYQVFVGPINYLQNLMITNYSHKDRVYRVVTYNDCLYDVIGSHLEDFDGSSHNAEPQIYNGLEWESRLNLLPYRAKIELRSMSGQELNEFHGHAMLAVSWMEDGLENSKTFEVRNDRRKMQE